jgi:hypothetical protein
MSAVTNSATETRLRPVPGRAGSCPRCAEPLDVERLHVPGWRALVEGRCAKCGHRYLQDLPMGHALVYPATLDLDDGTVLGGAGTEWFSGWLSRASAARDGREVDLQITGPGVHGPATLLDCLDPIYGHSVLKLLNADRALRAGERDVVVLVPRSLAHLVPDGVAETWTLEGPPSLAWEWLAGLDRRIGDELDRIGDCTLDPAFPHPHPSSWDLDTFTGSIEPARRGNPSIVFAFRDDRTWGLTRRHQDLNLRAAWRVLQSHFPDVGGALVGVGRPGAAPGGIEDLRAERPTVGDERAWLAAAKGADLVVGVHGSHMLLPSGLAALTLELVPAERHSNVVQATLVCEPDPLIALWRYRYVMGGAHLGDVTPTRVAALAAEMFQSRERYAALMTGAAAGIGDAPPDGLPPRAPGRDTTPAGERVRAALRRQARRVKR